jgi:hypothetical protein
MAQHRVSVKLVGRSCEHDLCVQIPHEVPPDLRCTPEQPTGYAQGGGSPCGCSVPDDLVSQVLRRLRDSLQEWRRLGYVVVPAAK